MFLSYSAHCLALLEASLDRTEITESESVELTITSDLNFSSSNNLFNLNTLSIPQPDVSDLEQDFEILDRQQSYRVQIINNRNESVITWKYTLLPRKQGDIVIPAIEYQGEKTEPVTLRVLETPPQSKQDKDVFLEAEVDLAEVYVQQQLIYTLRLYFSSGDLNLIGSESALEHPDHQQAVFTQIGDQKDYSRYVGTRRFNVIERTYAVFPKEPGELVIPSVNFSGSFIKRRMGRRVIHREATDPIAVQVKAPPASFSGRVWLPAQSLSIRDVWSDPAREIKVGDSLTRTVQMLALGLEGVQLPPLPNVDIGGLKVYPEPGKTATEEHAAGVTGSREEIQALIATQAGSYTLPEIRIPWWDVSNDEERVAILQGRVINVLPSAPGGSNPSPAMASPRISSNNNLNDPLSPSPPAFDAVQGSSGSTIVWQLATGALFLLWLITLFFWWRSKSAAPVPAVTNPANPTGFQQGLENLKQLAEQGSTNFINEITSWMNRARRQGYLSKYQANVIEQQIRQPLNKLQRSCYGPEQQPKLDKDVCNEIINLLQSQPIGPHEEKPTLAPFYPTTADQQITR